MTEGVFDFASKRMERNMTRGSATINADDTITLGESLEILDFDPSSAS